jgi:hypothetical protein
LQALGDVPAPPLSNDVRVPDADVSGSATKTPQSEGGVLGNLPRTRPQRSSARRAAARGAATSPARTRKTTRAKATKPADAKRQSGTRAKAQAKPKVTQKRTVEAVTASSAAATAKGSPPTPRPSSAVRAKRVSAAKRVAPPRPTAPLQEPAPAQGFECEGEAEGAVQPPGGAELVTAAAEIVGELAKAGLSTGERLLKDVFSRLSPS